MRYAMGSLILAVALSIWCPTLLAAGEPSFKEGSPATLSGKLQGGIMAIGGETTGWQVVQGEGEKATSTEVDMSAIEKPEAFDGVKVTVTGKMHLVKYVERGDVWILKAESVKKD